MGRSVEFRLDPIDRCDDARWLVGGEEREVNHAGELIILLDDLEYCRATDLQAALRRAARLCGNVDDPWSVVISGITTTKTW